MIVSAAQRYHIHPLAYVTTRTMADLRRDVGAMVASWAWPASALLGSGNDRGRPKAGDRKQGGHDVYSDNKRRLRQRYPWLRIPDRGRVNIIDLDHPDEKERTLAQKMLAGSMAQVQKAWGGDPARVFADEPRRAYELVDDFVVPKNPLEVDFLRQKLGLKPQNKWKKRRRDRKAR